VSPNESSPVLLDACVAINLLASGVPLVEFAEAFATRWATTRTAGGELLYLPASAAEDPLDEVDGVSLEMIADEVALDVVEMTPEEVDLFVAFAAEVDDGEASILAVAQQRGLRVATDDRKACRLGGAFVPPIEVVGTTEIVKRWSAADSVRAAHTPAIVARIESRASFRPRRDDPNRDWWEATQGRT
jgi:predicted nucleic acid-binding protein